MKHNKYKNKDKLMSQLVRIYKDYALWIEELSQRYRRSQIKAATHVNSEMLQFYWSLGKDIVTLKAENRRKAARAIKLRES